MARERDTQRSKLYGAENAARNKMPGAKLPKVADIERYLKRQAKRKTLVDRYGGAVDLEHWPVSIRDGRGTRIARGGANGLSLPGWAREEWVVLHEWAHMIHKRLDHYAGTGGSRRDELRGGAAHGWQYAAIYLDLVHFVMGKDFADELKAQYKAHKVRFRPKRVITSRKGIKPTFGKRPEVTDEMARVAVEGVAA